jgi:hypothetical protein
MIAPHINLISAICTNQKHILSDPDGFLSKKYMVFVDALVVKPVFLVFRVLNGRF